MEHHERLAKVARRQHGLITSVQADGAGIGRRSMQCRVEAGLWQRVGPSVLRLVGTPETPEQRALAAVLDAGPGAALTGTAAAWLWGTRRGAIRQIQVVVPDRRRRRNTATRFLIDEALGDHHVVVRRGVPVVTPARMLVDLAGIVSVRPLGRSLDNALRLRLTSLGLVSATLESLARQGRCGVRALRAAVIERRDGSPPPESALEQSVMMTAARMGLPLERQVDLFDSTGWVSRVDFVNRTERVVVLVDGATWHSALTDVQHDDLVVRRLRAAGYSVLRLSDATVVFDPSRTRQLLVNAFADNRRRPDVADCPANAK